MNGSKNKNRAAMRMLNHLFKIFRESILLYFRLKSLKGRKHSTLQVEGAHSRNGFAAFLNSECFHRDEH